MEEIEKMTLRQLYRGILKMSKTYPSKNRALIHQAILEDVRDWKKLRDELEVKKAIKRMRMLYGHFYMYKIKMEEINSDSGNIDKPLPFKDIN